MRHPRLSIELRFEENVVGIAGRTARLHPQAAGVDEAILGDAEPKVGRAIGVLLGGGPQGRRAHEADGQPLRHQAGS